VYQYGQSQGTGNINSKEDPNWTVEAINEAMKGEKQTIHILTNEIPVHIRYFTAWVDDIGKINFYNDLYQRDDRLADLLSLRIQSKTNQTS
jgi:murein L,D-transpeptidase YcbB/YkuD